MTTRGLRRRGQHVDGDRGDFGLPAGTKLVALDVKVDDDVVRIFAHTQAPVEVRGGQRVYGCTSRPAIGRGDVAAIEQGLAQAAVG